MLRGAWLFGWGGSGDGSGSPWNVGAEGRGCWLGALQHCMVEAMLSIAHTQPTHLLTLLLPQDLLGETPVPKQLKEVPSFAFLSKRLELALQAAG